ncbi:hypothetical protein [Paenibacillus protaetiae]
MLVLFILLVIIVSVCAF